MSLKEQLTEKKARLLEIEPQLKAEEVTDEVIAEGEELVKAIAELEESIAKAEKANELLKTIGTKSEDNNIDDTEVTKMTGLELFAQKAAEMTDRKAGVSVHMKAATDVVVAPQIADIDKSVAPQAKRTSISDFTTVAQISGNAITYFLQGEYEGAPAVTAQGAKKPQNSTSFEPVTVALSKIAAFIKETDEIIADAPFLASEVQNALVYQLYKAEDSEIVSAIAGTSGIGAAEYDTSADETLADGILQAILGIKGGSAYDAAVVLVNPADLYALMAAKDGNGQYLGGGYFTGAYGNGGYNMPVSIWGVPVIANSDITSGEALVWAKEAVKTWKKGGLDVKLYEQNEDDAIYNRVTLIGELREVSAVVDLKGVYAVAAKS